MSNLRIYEKVRTVPKNAQKEIKGGKLKGFTDINPMWRIKTLTETFGPCGFGWYYEMLNQWIEFGPDGRVAAFCNINLYVKDGDEWSKPIFGTGGSMFVDLERDKQRSSDECYKMALTDAISVACKSLGVAADVYWEQDRTKYEKQANEEPPTPPTRQPQKQSSRPQVCHDCGKDVKPVKLKNGTEVTVAEIMHYSEPYKVPLCYRCLVARTKQNE